tara:strand:+ start:1882 stop:4197 length:2316 start_codon:yes stop_codon:yes gene_type:complete
MADWKKVIVSGSNTHINHLTSSGNFSASGNLFGNLTENTNLTRVVVYNPLTGQLEQKELNLVQTIRAPRLFLADLDASSNSSDTRFKLSFDSSSNTSEPITAPYLISASYTPHGLLRTNANTEFLINGAWDDVDAVDQVYFEQSGPTNLTGSVNDVRNGLITGASKEDIVLHLNTVKEFTIASVTSGKNNDPVPAHDPTAATKNYLVNAFDCPIPTDTGSLEVYVNDTAAPKAVFSLTGSNGNNNITTAVNNITPTIFASQSNLNNFGELDSTKSNRSGSITIGQTHQVDGYNYAYVLHTGSRSGTEFAHITNFVEWFYDNNGAGQAMSATEGNANSLVTEGTTTTSISGIKYFTSEFKLSKIRRFDCTNQYKNIYSRTGGIRLTTTTTNTADKFSVTQSGVFITSEKKTAIASPDGSDDVDLQSLQSTANAHTEQTRVTCSFEFHPGSVTTVHFPSDFKDNDTSNGVPNYPGGSTAADCQGSTLFTHVNKTNTTGLSATFNDFLMITQNSGSTSETEIEQFRGEKFRVQDRSYSTGDNPTSYLWDGTQNIGNNGASEYRDGLLIFSSHLVYPTNAGESSDGGDFTTGTGPTQDNDYSSGATQEATGVRNYIRYFKVPAGGNRSAQLEFKGRGKVVRDANTLNGQEFKVFLQRLGTSDANSFFNSGFKNLLDSDCRDGALITTDAQHIPLTNTLSSIDYGTSLVEGINVATSVVAFSEAAGAPAFTTNEHILVKIECPDGWEGFIDAMALRFGSQDGSTASVLNALGSSQQ